MNKREKEVERFMDPGAYFETVVITILSVVTFVTIVLFFIYMIFVKEESPTTKT